MGVCERRSVQEVLAKCEGRQTLPEPRCEAGLTTYRELGAMAHYKYALNIQNILKRCVHKPIVAAEMCTIKKILSNFQVAVFGGLSSIE